MPHVTLTEPAGEKTVLDIPLGQTVMQAAVNAGVGGIVGECGGSAMCATCHVYVDPAWADQLPAPSAPELEMLEGTASERSAESRLSCQIRMTAALDGLRLRTPERQQ